MDRKHRGARNELLGICWLMSLGYEVFRNVSPHGAVDVIATNNNETLYLDIKKVWAPNAAVPYATPEQRARGVKVLLVSPEGTCEIKNFREEVIGICKMCSKPISSRRRKSIYCSDFCQHRAHRIRHGQLVKNDGNCLCRVCGKIITDQRRTIYCSKFCLDKSKRLKSNERMVGGVVSAALAPAVYPVMSNLERDPATGRFTPRCDELEDELE